MESVESVEEAVPTMVLEATCGSIHWLHKGLLRVTVDLSWDQFSWRPGPQAPPIGWHLWHIARWADHIRTAMPVRNGVPLVQIWDEEGLALRYGLDRARLGLLQCGEGMQHEDAASLPQVVGQENIMDYARRSFTALDEAIDRVTPQEAAWVRPNCRPYTATPDKRIVAAPPQEQPLYNELLFHLNHAARHLGMIEALRGAQDLFGTASA